MLARSNAPRYLVGAAHPPKADAPRAGERATSIVMGHRHLSARDALNVAVMPRQGISQILTLDTGFDGFPGVERLH